MKHFNCIDTSCTFFITNITIENVTVNPLYRKLHAQISWITETWYIQYNTGLTYSTLSLFTTVVSLPQEIIAQIAGKSYLGGYNWFLFFIFFYFVPVPFRCVFYFCSVAINCFTVSGLTYSTLSLFTTVVYLITAFHLNGWKLNAKLGAALMLWYLLFMTFASMYELNVFGDFNPPECSSSY